VNTSDPQEQPGAHTKMTIFLREYAALLIMSFIDHDKTLQSVCWIQFGIEFLKTPETNCSAERGKVCAATL
jgi:hypothetical protein